LISCAPASAEKSDDGGKNRPARRVFAWSYSSPLRSPCPRNFWRTRCMTSRHLGVVFRRQTSGQYFDRSPEKFCRPSVSIIRFQRVAIARNAIDVAVPAAPPRPPRQRRVIQPAKRSALLGQVVDFPRPSGRACVPMTTRSPPSRRHRSSACGRQPGLRLCGRPSPAGKRGATTSSSSRSPASRRGLGRTRCRPPRAKPDRARRS